MECNKDEAIRARSIAEKNMENNDFEGARKMVLKARNLYPELENISQLLYICDVHCSAQRKLLGHEKDWYGILQTEKLADELTVKKQYRRLALSLHPDKNRFPGAEGAFKLICEANAVLSDATKKSLYDNKIRFLVKSGSVNPSSHHTYGSSQFNNPNTVAQNNVSNGFSGLNQHQATQSMPSAKQEVFWTSCPYCGVRYQYLRQFIRRSLRCQTCSKIFVGYDIGAQGASVDSKKGQSGIQNMSSRPGLGQTAASQEKVAQNQGNFRTVCQKDKGPSVSHAQPPETTGGRTVKPKPHIQTGSGAEGIQEDSSPNINVNMETKDMDICDTKSSHGAKAGGASNGDAMKKKTVDVKNKRRGRKVVEESSEDLDSLSENELEDVNMTGKFGDGATNKKSESVQVRSSWRSSRKRQQVSYNEADEDDDLAIPKRPQVAKESEEKARKDTKHGNQNNFPNDANSCKSKETGGFQFNGNLQEGDAGCDKGEKPRGNTDSKSDSAADQYETKTDLEKDDNMGTLSYCPDPEFGDFDKVRDEKQFAANQFWACYDTLDGMPRFYAKVKKVYTNPFNLIITWLEAVPINSAFNEWVDNELPTGCGTFKFGQTEETSIRLSFSHPVHCERGKKRGSYIVHPREGEVWSLFKDWNISWAADPANHKEEFKYEIVEVLSDFVVGAGIKVCYLDKVEGFVSIFQRTSESEDDSFLIGPGELYKFSHRVPCYKMMGTEREGVPVGSFELDPAALPLKPEDLHYPSKAKVEGVKTASGLKLGMKNGKPKDSDGLAFSPRKPVDAKGEGEDDEISILQKSPQKLKLRKSPNKKVM